MQQLERRSDRWVSTGLSVLLHGAVLALLVYGWWTWRHPSRPAPTLAIDATVVSSKALNGGATLKPATPPTVDDQTVPPPKTAQMQQAAPPQTVMRPAPVPAPAPQTTPPPTADDQTVPPPKPASAEIDEQQAKQARDAEQKVAAEAERRKAAQREAQEQARREAEAQAVAERKAKQAEAKKRAEQQRLAEVKRKAEADRKAAHERKLAAQRKADAERRADEAKALALSQADLQRGVAEEERLLAARSGPAMASWVQQIQARIQHAWIRPPTAKPGIDCTIDVTQVPGGQIVNVKLGACNGDGAVRQSIQDAVYRASPLPPPPDPALFERDLQIEFKPTD